MKRKIKFLSIALIFCIAFINFGCLERVSAARAPRLTSLTIDSYSNYNKSKIYNKNSNPTLSVDDFPLIINTTQEGYGNCILYLDEKELKGDECRTVYKRGSGYIVTGFETQFKINPSTSKLYKGYHTLKVGCTGSAGGLKFASFDFYIA